MSADSPIDVPLLLDRCMDDVDLTLRLLERFEQQAMSDLESLQGCVSVGDAIDAAKRAHALKGIAGAIAATQLAEAAAELEEASRTNALDRLAASMNSVADEMRRCLGSFENVRGELATRRPPTEG